MGEDYFALIEEKVGQSTEHKGVARITCLQEAARLADLHNDIETGMELRYMIVEEANNAGLNEHALLAFTWMLGKIDADPEAEDSCPVDLMWLFKWIGETAGETPRLTREQIQSLLDDMERRYVKMGLSLRAVEQVRSLSARIMGDCQNAREHLRKAREYPDDDAADCPACQTNALVELLAFTGELDEAVRVAKPIFNGRESCEEVPALTAGALMMPLFSAGRIQEADAWQRKVHRRISRDGELLDVAGESLLFLTATDQTRRAINLMDKKLRFAFEAVSPLGRLHFWQGCHLLCRRLFDTGRRTVKLKRFAEMPWSPDTDGKFDVAELGAWFYEQAADLSRQFDERNGNTHYTTMLADSESLVDRVQPIPPGTAGAN